MHVTSAIRTFGIRELNDVLTLENVHLLNTRYGIHLHSLQAVLQLRVICGDDFVSGLLLPMKTLIKGLHKKRCLIYLRTDPLPPVRTALANL